MQQYDIVVVGGGMVGAAIACGFAMQQRKVAMIDPSTPAAFDPHSRPDLRLSAFSLGSERLLRELGAWPFIEKMRLTPYIGLQTWEAGQTDKLKFDCHEVGQDHLGYMIENRIVQLALWQRCRELGVTLLPWNDWQLTQTPTHATLTYQQQSIRALLVVGADGAKSTVRQQTGLGITGWDYRQRCLSINVKFAKAPERITWQEFYPSGPRALLPLYDDYGTLIWYDQSARIKSLQGLKADALKTQIQAAFPALEGEFELLDWANFALVRRHVHQYFKGRVVLAGDSAHTIHPLAGQGVNIGFKDVATLLRIFKEHSLNEPFETLLVKYQRQRKCDNLLMQSAMDLFYKGFSHPHSLVKTIRRAGIIVAEHAGVAKTKALRYALGIN
ncbi:FAD-dependent monooxygenase [Celerinatantimonas diazotrophica]|uniref:2-octaprenyl-3-methyl-6-methoxy-1,4-benzoquinol hydroxylase n=1 Tax=Celerinatantimonas diazotrophica TaxID=412034 RepID=A0A4R1K4H8_9GAMM|nr:FAD-dependent monooxygenase [Celerinatantimonas diazotrophica]TCK58633.1 2-octaprenyl-3-methyl-6-methoxy-1,4-benzoquinol hydroxylase [Celerinatantimonas diazotrophica]CAG9297262.1 3-demethoxyubiquinol 3-hydroxylase [Celerinatantimonas diazotrophica]